MAEAKAAAIVFEEYDFPGFQTIGGIAPVGPNRAAWFKDSEGNLSASSSSPRTSSPGQPCWWVSPARLSSLARSVVATVR